MTPPPSDREKADSELMSELYCSFNLDDHSNWGEQIKESFRKVRATERRQVLESEEVKVLVSYVQAWSEFSNGEPTAKAILESFTKLREGK